MRLKIFGFIFFTLAIAYLCAPAVDGLLTKQMLLKVIDNYNLSQPNKISVVDYSLGWKKSVATFRVSLKTLQHKNAPSDLIIVDNITHGPFIRDESTSTWTIAKAINTITIELPNEVKQFITENNGTLPTFTISSIATFANDYNSTLTMSPMRVDTAVGRFAWKGMNLTVNAHVNTDNKIDRLVQNVELLPVSFDSNSSNAQVRMSSLTSQGVRECKQFANLCDSNGVSKLGSIRFTAADEDVYSLSNVSGVLITKVDSDNFTMDYKSTFGNYTSPEFSVAPFRLNFSINNVKALALNAWLEMGARSLNTIDMNSKMEQTGLAMQMLNDVPKLLSTKTLVASSVEGNTSFGKFHADLQLNWPKLTSEHKSIEMVSKSTEVLMNVRVATKLIDQILVLSAEDKQKKAGVDLVFADKQNPIVAGPVQNSLTDYLGNLVVQKHISDETNKSIVGLVGSNLSVEVFNSTIDELVSRKSLSILIGNEIKSQYQVLQTANSSSLSRPVQTNLVQKNPSADAQKQIDAIVAQKFLVIDHDDYIATITISNGMLSINGVLRPELMGLKPQAPQSQTDPH